MRALSSSDLLDLWERGSRLHPLDRALLALTAAQPEVTAANLADWPLGRRNQALLELHCSSFGSSLQGWTACARCGEKMEFEMDSRAMARPGADGGSGEPNILVKGQSFRLPTSRDMALVAGEIDSQAAAIGLVERCRVDGAEAIAWSEEELEEVGEQMALADPLAEIRLALRCPVCGDESAETLDVVSFVWAEISARAKRLLWDIHAIASAYGWTESEVLSLSPARRALYLEMVQP